MTVEINSTNILLFASVLGAVAAIIGYLKKICDKLGEPSKRLDKHDKILAKDDKRLSDLEAEQRLLLRSILALTSHELDGNHTQQLKDSKAEIEQYLISK